MIDAIRDLIQNGQPLVVYAPEWPAIERGLRSAGISFWGWMDFQGDDGADLVGVSVPGNRHAEAQAIANTGGEQENGWGIATKAIGALLLVGLAAFVLMLGGAL